MYLLNRIDLTNRHAVVTGGGQGIGLSIAKRLLASGASVTLWDQNEEALASAEHELGPGDHVSSRKVDVSNYEQVTAAVSQHAGIDILVANAGISGPNFPTWEYPIEDWEKILRINLTGVFYCCRAVLPHMLEKNYGRIVNVASIAGKEGNPNASVRNAKG